MKVAIIDPSGFTLPYDHSLASALAQEGCRVVLAATRVPPGPWAGGEIPYERWELFYRLANRLGGKRSRTYLKGCEHPFDMLRLLRRLRRWKPDVIHFQWLPLPLIDGFFLPRLRKMAPLVLTVHDTEPFHGAPSSRFQLVGLSSASSGFDHYIVHTHYSKEALVRRSGIPARRVSVIPHGVLGYYHELAGEVSGPIPEADGRKMVLFFGVLKPYKGLDTLLEAFARLPEPMAQETVLQIVGYPKMPAEPLRALAGRLGIESRIVWDLRFVEESEVALYFSRAEVVVLPYRRIDQSGVLMTALAFGKPIVASRVGGFAEIIDDGEHGFLVEPGNPEALAQALRRILEDCALRARMAEAVERLAGGDLSWNSIAKQTLHLYQTLPPLFR